MTINDLVAHFGSKVAAGRALGRSKQAVNKWRGKLPARLQFEIEARTQGALKVDDDLKYKRLHT